MPAALSPYRKKVHLLKLRPIVPSSPSASGSTKSSNTEGDSSSSSPSGPSSPSKSRYGPGSYGWYKGQSSPMPSIPSEEPTNGPGDVVNEREYPFKAFYSRSRGVHASSLRGCLAAAWNKRAELELEFSAIHTAYLWWYMAAKILENNSAMTGNLLQAAILKQNKNILRRLSAKSAIELKSARDEAAAHVESLQAQHATSFQALESRSAEERQTMQVAHRSEVDELISRHAAEIEKLQTSKSEEISALSEARRLEVEGLVQKHQEIADGLKEVNSRQKAAAAEAATRSEEVLKRLKEDHAMQLLAMDQKNQALDQAGKGEAEKLRSAASKKETEAQRKIESLQKQHQDMLQDMQAQRELALSKKDREIDELKRRHHEDLEDLRTEQAAAHQALLEEMKDSNDAVGSDRERALLEREKVVEDCRKLRAELRKYEDLERKQQENLVAEQQRNEEMLQMLQAARAELRDLKTATETEDNAGTSRLLQDLKAARAELRDLKAATETEGAQKHEDLQMKHEDEEDLKDLQMKQLERTLKRKHEEDLKDQEDLKDLQMKQLERTLKRKHEEDLKDLQMKHEDELKKSKDHPKGRMLSSMLSIREDCPPSSSIARSQDDEELAEGMRVVIKGLTTKPEFNGMHGVIESWVAAKEKWVVRLDNDQRLSVLPEYLHAAATTPQEDLKDLDKDELERTLKIKLELERTLKIQHEEDLKDLQMQHEDERKKSKELRDQLVRIQNAREAEMSEKVQTSNDMGSANSSTDQETREAISSSLRLELEETREALEVAMSKLDEKQKQIKETKRINQDLMTQLDDSEARQKEMMQRFELEKQQREKEKTPPTTGSTQAPLSDSAASASAQTLQPQYQEETKHVGDYIPKPPNAEKKLRGLTQLAGCVYWDVVLQKSSESDKFGFAMDYCPEALLVRRVEYKGLLDRWNEAHPDAEVRCGDRIVMVNEVVGVHQMQQMLRSPLVTLRVARFPSNFGVVLSKQGGMPLGFRFERPRNKALEELRITEILEQGCITEHNAAQIAAGCWHQVVFAEMRIESVNGVSGDATLMADELRTCTIAKLGLRRESDQVKAAKQKIKQGMQGIAALSAFGGLGRASAPALGQS